MKKIIIKVVNVLAIIKSVFFGYRVCRVKALFEQKYYSIILSKKLKGDVTAVDFPVINGTNCILLSGKLTIGHRNRIEAIELYYGQKFKPKIRIGDGVILGDNCHIGSTKKITIGDNTLVGSNVLIIDHSHGDINMLPSIIQKNRDLKDKGEVKIGSNCRVGDDVKILPGVQIGNNCIIGAGSVLTKKFLEDNCVIAGNPARIIKRLK